MCMRDRLCWDGITEQACKALLGFFQVPYEDGHGLTLASLRAGGATYLYLRRVPLDLIRWHGRWQTARTVEIYVQESAALTLLPSLPSSHTLKAFPFAWWSSYYSLMRYRLQYPPLVFHTHRDPN